MSKFLASVAGAALWVSLCAPVQAATVRAQGRAADLKALVDCRSVTDPGRRLSCYDKAVADLDRAEAGGDIVVVDRQQAQAVRRQAFGLNFSALSIFDRGVAREEAETLTAKVKTARQNPDGRWVIELEDGAVWRQIDGDDLGAAPRAGATVVISHGSVGSFFVRFDHGVSMRAHRDR
ncbi:MAG: hypothetical protein P4L64_04520 [Caulobacteraceae bacterium]|nr:hypothetical protein [Caulobacteraceae bacterium]